MLDQTPAPGPCPISSCDWDAEGTLDDHLYCGHEAEDLAAAVVRLALENDRLNTALEVATAQHAKAVVARDKAQQRAKISDGIQRAEKAVFQTAIRDLGGEPVQVQNLYAQLRLRNRQWEDVKADNARLRAEQAVYGDLFDTASRVLATSALDWSERSATAWLWGVINGWDCARRTHDDTCAHGAMKEMVAKHGWDAETVATIRRFHTAITYQPPTAEED
jgi:hypothetical protein